MVSSAPPAATHPLSPERALSRSRRDGSVDVCAAPPLPKNAFQAFLDAGDEDGDEEEGDGEEEEDEDSYYKAGGSSDSKDHGSDPMAAFLGVSGAAGGTEEANGEEEAFPQFDLDNSVKVWPDFLKVHTLKRTQKKQQQLQHGRVLTNNTNNNNNRAASILAPLSRCLASPLLPPGMPMRTASG